MWRHLPGFHFILNPEQVGKEAESDGKRIDMVRWTAGFQVMALAAAANRVCQLELVL